MSFHPDWLIPAWSVPGVGAVMTTRRGGFSAPPYDAMNLQSGGGDTAEAVARNRAVLAEATGARPVFLKQVHGTAVARLGSAGTEVDRGEITADASWTTTPGVACTVQVADCLPVLFAAPAGRAVAAAHAGWRGLAAGVLEAALSAVCDAARCAPTEVEAWLGAAIGPTRFQVGADVLRAFAGEPGVPRRGFVTDASAGKGGAPPKWLADLPLLARERLHAAGVGRVHGGTWCTVSEPSRFFSFRRDRLTGRMAAAIWIEPR